MAARDVTDELWGEGLPEYHVNELTLALTKYVMELRMRLAALERVAEQRVPWPAETVERTYQEILSSSAFREAIQSEVQSRLDLYIRGLRGLRKRIEDPS